MGFNHVGRHVSWVLVLGGNPRILSQFLLTSTKAGVNDIRLWEYV